MWQIFVMTVTVVADVGCGVPAALSTSMYKHAYTTRTVPCRYVLCRYVPCRYVPCRDVPCKYVLCRYVLCKYVYM